GARVPARLAAGSAGGRGPPAGDLPRRVAQPRPLRPQAAVRSLGARHRRQALAQLAAQARPIPGSLLRRGDPGPARPTLRAIRDAARRQLRRAPRRAARLHGVPVAGPAHGNRPALPARPALQGDRAAPRRGFRGGEEAPAARTRGAAALPARQAAFAATGERMNADPMSGESAREPWEVWSELDDTLADGGVDAPAEVPLAE